MELLLYVYKTYDKQEWELNEELEIDEMGKFVNDLLLIAREWYELCPVWPGCLQSASDADGFRLRMIAEMRMGERLKEGKRC